MQLYSGGSSQFIEDAVQNQVAEKLRAAFLDHYRYAPSPGEVSSWRNALSKMKDVLQRAWLLDCSVQVNRWKICRRDRRGAIQAHRP